MLTWGVSDYEGNEKYGFKVLTVNNGNDVYVLQVNEWDEGPQKSFVFFTTLWIHSGLCIDY